MTSAILALLLFAAAVLAGYGIAGLLSARQAERRLLRNRLSTMVAGAGSGRRVAILRDRRLSAIGVVNRFLAGLSLVGPLERQQRPSPA